MLRKIEHFIRRPWGLYFGVIGLTSTVCFAVFWVLKVAIDHHFLAGM